jgi:hypothetical protein
VCVPKTASKPTTRPFAQGWWLAMMAHVGGRQPDGHHRKRFPACRLMRIGFPPGFGGSAQGKPPGYRVAYELS